MGGLTLNLFLLIGVCSRVAWLILIWLLSYAVGVCGCIILFGFMLNILIVRNAIEEDVSIGTYILCSVPLLLSLIHI